MKNYVNDSSTDLSLGSSLTLKKINLLVFMDLGAS